MQVRQKLVPLGEMSRLPDNSALQYFKDAQPFNMRIGDDEYVIPHKQMFVLIGGRSSLASTYRVVGPAKLMLHWSSEVDTVEPNLWVIRHKQLVGHNYTILAFGGIIKPIDKNNVKNPVYDLRKELGDTSREKIANFISKVLPKK